MLRINMAWIQAMLTQIDSIEFLRDQEEPQRVLFAKFSANQAIDSILASPLGAFMRGSRQKAVHTKQQYDVLTYGLETPGAEVKTYNLWSMKNATREFKTVLLAEIAVIPSYVVTSKAGYDMNILLDEGVRIFPTDMVAKVPLTAVDAQEAGKALAFELGTACGFHCFRVLETVLKTYWSVVSNGAEAPKQTTIGAYVAKLESLDNPDEKVIEALRQIARLHRNPIVHPQVLLSIDEAVDILGIVRSAVAAMLRVIPQTNPMLGTGMLLSALAGLGSSPAS